MSHDYNGGTIQEDDRLHAVTRAGSTRFALCRKGRIRHTVPVPFAPGGDGSCDLCAQKVRENRDLME
jgi:hypothetical protein